MKRVTVIFILLLALGIVPTLAQDTALYQDPAGRFSVPIPSGWSDESKDQVGRFVSPDGIVVSTLATEATDAASGDKAVLTALTPELSASSPVQTNVQPSPSGRWAARIYAPASNRLVVLATQWVNGVTYALLFDIPGQDVFAANQGPIVGVFNGFVIGKRLDLTGVQPKPFTAEMLAQLKAYIDDARQRFHVPGVSLAIVQSGHVVYTDGFGTTEPEGGQPVTADTLFMIGSVTKSMTTMMMSTLVDDGVLDWNKPVTDIFPLFALSNSAATKQIRVRDLVNMSSGVSRYDIITNLVDFTPQELIASLTEIPLVAAPGQMWNYSNQMVAAGGYISALAAGASKDALYEGYVNLVQNRVFDPIGMSNTTFDFEAAIANQNHALPYAYNPVTKEYMVVPLNSERFTGQIAPAGAVWSNAADMARYLQTELSGGVSPDGERVISVAALHTTQSPEITPGGLYASYGMGWGIDSYNGLPMVLHGGNTIGFTSDLAFLPSANLGVIVLTDAAEANNFTAMVRQYIFELAFGLDHDASQRLADTAEMQAPQQPALPSSNAVDSATVAPYLGVYEHGISVEMRGDELWLIGAFVQTALNPAKEPGEYVGTGVYSALGVHFIKAGDKFSLEVTYPDNPSLTLRPTTGGVVDAPIEVTFPDLTGPYAVGKMEYDLIDKARPETFTEDTNDKRELMVTVYYPGNPEPDAVPAPFANGILAQALRLSPELLARIHSHAFEEIPVSAAESKYPVIIFSPGMGNLPLYYSATLEDLASNGYIVVSISHPYSTAITIFPDNRVILANEAGSQLHTSSLENDARARARILNVWVGDVQFVLDQLEQAGEHDPLLGGHLDLTHVGMFGHSFGGETAVKVTSLDSRLKAALSLDGQVTGSVLENGMTQPFMILRSERFSITDEQLKAAGITREEFEASYAEIERAITSVYQSSQNGYLLSLKGTTHETYTTDYPLFAPLLPVDFSPEVVGTIDGTRAVTIINTYVVAFFNKHLKSEVTALLDGPSPDYPEVTFESHKN